MPSASKPNVSEHSFRRSSHGPYEMLILNDESGNSSLDVDVSSLVPTSLADEDSFVFVEFGVESGPGSLQREGSQAAVAHQIPNATISPFRAIRRFTRPALMV